MSKITDWKVFGAEFERRMGERAAADWSKRRTFRLIIRDHEFTEADYVADYVTAGCFGDVYVRTAPDDESRAVLVDVRENVSADAFRANVTERMGIAGSSSEYVCGLSEVPTPTPRSAQSVLNLLPWSRHDVPGESEPLGVAARNYREPVKLCRGCGSAGVCKVCGTDWDAINRNEVAYQLNDAVKPKP